MTISEQSRYELHRQLEEVLGPEHASTLMAHLPPVGWADVATKHDLAALEQRMDLRFDAIDLPFDAIDLRFDAIDLRFAAIDQRFNAIDQRFNAADRNLDDRFAHFETSMMLELHKTMNANMQVIMFGMISSLAVFAGVIIAAVKL